MRWIVLLTSALLVVVLSGCVDLEPRQSNIQYYVLGASAVPQPLQPDTSGVRVGVRKLRLAPYLDTPTIVTRKGPNEIGFSEFHRWGEDPERAINRIVAVRMAAQEGIGTVDVVPWPEQATYDAVVQIRVLRFEGEIPPPPGPDEERDEDEPRMGTAHLRATWDVIDPETDDILARETTNHQVEGWPVGNYADLVAKLDSALDVLARDIAVRARDIR